MCVKCWRTSTLPDELYHRRGNLDQAEAACRQVLEIDPTYAQAYLRIGMIYEERAGRGTEK